MKQRAMQVSEELRKAITHILLREINDPQIGFMTVTRIEVTDDLRFAKVFYSVLGDEDQKQSTIEALSHHMGKIKKLANEMINMKFAIDIRMDYDKSIENSFAVDRILKEIKEKESRKDS